MRKQQIQCPIEFKKIIETKEKEKIDNIKRITICHNSLQGFENILLDFLMRKEKRKILFHASSFLPIKLFFKCANSKENEIEKLYQKGLNIIETNISYLNYLKVIKELNNLKKILFTPNQLALFKLISKPDLSEMSNECPINEDDYEDIESFEILKNAYEYVKKLMQDDREISQIDKNLISLLDYDLCKVFMDAIESEF